MRPEVRWGLTAILALGLGVMLAKPYARLAAPYYGAIARLIAVHHPWEVTTVEVAAGTSGLGAELRLEGHVRRHREDQIPAARVIGRVQVGEVIETPLLFWALLLMWPARSPAQRIARLGIGVPVGWGWRRSPRHASSCFPWRKRPRYWRAAIRTQCRPGITGPDSWKPVANS